MKVYLPESCDESTVFAVLGQVFNEDGESYSDHYHFDARAVSSLDPFSLVVLNNAFAWLVHRGHAVRVDLPDNIDARSSLLTYIHKEGVCPFNTVMNVHEGIIPLAHIPSEKSSSWVLTTFNRWLAEILGVSTLSLFSHMQFVRLLFHYAVQYGQSEGVILHCVFDRDEPHLRIILAHYGKGIPDLTRNSWSAFANPALVIARATEGKSQEAEGPSLMFLVDDVIVENGGHVSIYSGYGHMKIARNQLGITQKLGLNNAYVPGTVFDITFRMDVTGLMSTDDRINEPGGG